MEFLEGAPLRGPFAPPEAVRLAAQIAAALCSELDAAADWCQKAIEQHNPFVMGLSHAPATTRCAKARAGPRSPK
jgi:hypothetical protein